MKSIYAFVKGDYQKIDAQKLRLPSNTGFGFSLSKDNTDVDKNAFSDFAVGAPFGGPSVVLKSRPVVSFNLEYVYIYNMPDQDPSVKGKFEIALNVLFENSWTLLFQSLKLQLVYRLILGHYIPKKFMHSLKLHLMIEFHWWETNRQFESVSTKILSI